MKPVIVVRYSSPKGEQQTTHFEHTKQVQDFVYTRIRSPRTGAATVMRHLAYAAGNPLHMLEEFAINGHRFKFEVTHAVPTDCDCIRPVVTREWAQPEMFEVPC